MDESDQTWWAWSGVTVRAVPDPRSEPPDVVVLVGPVDATEADATRAFLRWFHLLRSGTQVDGAAAGGLWVGWSVRPVRDGADRPHDPFAWDGRDVALATLTSCRTIEDLEALGNPFPLAKTLFGDRATRPLARALGEAVFETLAQGHTSFSAIRLAVAAAPLLSSEQLVEVLSWDDRGELVVPAGQVRALADDLFVLFCDIKSARRRLALVEGAWAHAVALAKATTDINACVSVLARRRKVSVASAVRYLDRVVAGASPEARELVASLLSLDIAELVQRDQRAVSIWRLPDIVRGRAEEAVAAASGCTSIGLRSTRRQPAESREIEQRRLMADVAASVAQRHPWLRSDAVTDITSDAVRRQLERDEYRWWSETVRRATQEVDPSVAPPWLLNRWPVDLAELVGLIANHHRLTRTTSSQSRARTWASFARDVSSFELGDLAVPDVAWIGELDGAVLPGDLTVSVARSSRTLLEWSDYMRNCIHSTYRLDAIAGEIVFVGLSDADGTLRYNASLSPRTGYLLEMAARFNHPAPARLRHDLEDCVRGLWQQEQRRTLDEADVDELDAAPVRRRRDSRGGARRMVVEANRLLERVEAHLKRDDPDRDQAMQLVLDLGAELGLRRGDWRITVRRLGHVDDERLRDALGALGTTRVRRAQRRAFLDWDPLDGLDTPEPLADALASVRSGADDAETTRPIRVLRSLELRTRWLLARLQRRVAVVATPHGRC